MTSILLAGIATWDNSAPEVSSGLPTTLHGAQSARKWLDGQISPPRHLATPLRLRNPAAITLPLLMPPALAQEGRPTPRLATAQPDSQVPMLALRRMISSSCMQAAAYLSTPMSLRRAMQSSRLCAEGNAQHGLICFCLLL